MDNFYLFLAEVFAGYQDGYGVSIVNNDHIEGTKRGAKSFWKHEKLTDEVWKAHAEGRTSIGVSPLGDKSKIRWGAIDIDEYTIQLVDLIDKIESNNLPIVLFRSKSGGAHLFVFFTEAINAKIAREAMSNMATIMGFPGVEIFPKQDKRSENLPYGNWINIPYFNAEETDRYAIDKNGNAVLAEHFKDHLFEKRIGKQAVEYFANLKVNVNAPKEENEPLKGGPPCLNKLIVEGFPPNTRNNSLFNFGVYAKKAAPQRWKEYVTKFNEEYISPSLETKEVNNIIRSLDVNDYNYKCNDVPIVNVCNKARCMSCQFGIRATDEMPAFGRLQKTLSDPPLWSVSIVDGGEVELTTEELQSPRLFQKKALEAFNIITPIPKPEEWRMIIKGLLDNLKVVEIPDDTNPKDMVIIHLWEYLEGRVQAKERKELLAGKPWENDKKHHFSMKSFKRYLTQMKFNALPDNKITTIVKNIKGLQHRFMNIQGKGMNLWVLPVRETQNEKTENE